jgi:Sulfatase
MRPNRGESHSLLASAAAVAFGLFGAMWATTEARAQETKPNILFVLMDNLGYGELGVYGGGVVRGAPTPRIDALAAEGTRLTNFNVEAQCTPSRSAIMTGRFSIRSGTQSIPIGGEFDGLTRWEVTIADVLSTAGYATGAFGKWHLGSVQERLPNHHARVQSLLVSVQRVPRRQSCRTDGQLRIRGNHAKLDLAEERLLAIGVPAHVELTLELLDPVLGRLMGRMRGTGCDVQEKRFVWSDALDLADPGDRLIGKIGRQMIGGVGGTRHELVILVENRIPMVHVARVEAVEIVESQSVSPSIERSGRAELPGRRVVVLTDPGGHVTVLAQHLAHRAAAFRQDARVAVISGCQFGDTRERRRMMVATRDQRGACRAA